jgi:hypothetical protein
MFSGRLAVLSPPSPSPTSVPMIPSLHHHNNNLRVDGGLTVPPMVGPGEIPSPNIFGAPSSPGGAGRPSSRNRLRLHTSLPARSAMIEMQHSTAAGSGNNSPQLTPTRTSRIPTSSSGNVSLLAATREAAAIAAAEQLIVSSLKGESAAALTAGLKESNSNNTFMGPPSPPAPVTERRPSMGPSSSSSPALVSSTPGLGDRRPSYGGVTPPTHERRPSYGGSSLLITPQLPPRAPSVSPRTTTITAPPAHTTTSSGSRAISRQNSNNVGISTSASLDNLAAAAAVVAANNNAPASTHPGMHARKPSNSLSAVAAILAAAAAATAVTDITRPSPLTPTTPKQSSLASPSSATSSPRLTPTNASTATKASHHNIVLARSEVVQSPSPELSSSSLLGDKQVMISYSHKDQDFAKKVAAALKDVIIYYILS